MNDRNSIGPWVRSGAMRGIVTYLESIGIEAETVVGRDGLRMAEATDPYRKVDLITVLKAFEALVKATGKPDLILELGLGQRMDQWGPFGYLFLNAPNVIEALGDLCRYAGALQSHATFKLSSTDEDLTISYRSNHPELQGWELDSEITITFLMCLVNAVAGATVKPLSIRFDHPAARDACVYRERLGVMPEFEGADNQLTYSRGVAEQINHKANPELYIVLKRHVRDLALVEREEDTLLQRVRNNINRGLRDGTATLEHIAAESGLEPRTLQRRLGDEGKTFQALVNEMRVQRARYYLESTNLSVTDIAMEVGYAESSVFVRAFKRQTGTTPSRYRKAPAAP